MTELRMVWMLTTGGLLAVAFGVWMSGGAWSFQRRAVRTTGVVGVTPDDHWVIRYMVHDREFERIIDRAPYNEELMSLPVGTHYSLLCDPVDPVKFETTRGNTDKRWGGVMLAALGTVFASLGVLSLRYLAKSSRRAASGGSAGHN